MKIALSRKQVLLLVWAAVITAAFVYLFVIYIIGIKNVAWTLGNLEEITAEESRETYRAIYAKDLTKGIVALLLIFGLYFSFAVLFVKKLLVRSSLIKDRINPPTL